MALLKATRKLKRVGKSAVQFRITSTFEFIELECKGTWRPESLRVIWLRNHRKVKSNDTTLVVSEDFGPNGAKGRAVFNPAIAVSLVVTLYRDPHQTEFDEKEYKYYVEHEGAGGKKILATFNCNVADFVGIPSTKHALDLNFKCVSKKVKEVKLGITLESQFVKEGGANDDDMQSTFSAMSAGQDSMMYDEEDDDEEEVGGGEGGAGSGGGGGENSFNKVNSSPSFKGNRSRLNTLQEEEESEANDPDMCKSIVLGTGEHIKRGTVPHMAPPKPRRNADELGASTGSGQDQAVSEGGAGGMVESTQSRSVESGGVSAGGSGDVESVTSPPPAALPAVSITAPPSDGAEQVSDKAPAAAEDRTPLTSDDTEQATTEIEQPPSGISVEPEKAPPTSSAAELKKSPPTTSSAAETEKSPPTTSSAAETKKLPPTTSSAAETKKFPPTTSSAAETKKLPPTNDVSVEPEKAPPTKSSNGLPPAYTAASPVATDTGHKSPDAPPASTPAGEVSPVGKGSPPVTGKPLTSSTAPLSSDVTSTPNHVGNLSSAGNRSAQSGAGATEEEDKGLESGVSGEVKREEEQRKADSEVSKSVEKRNGLSADVNDLVVSSGPHKTGGGKEEAGVKADAVSDATLSKKDSKKQPRMEPDSGLAKEEEERSPEAANGVDAYGRETSSGYDHVFEMARSLAAISQASTSSTRRTVESHDAYAAPPTVYVEEQNGVEEEVGATPTKPSPSEAWLDREAMLVDCFSEPMGREKVDQADLIGLYFSAAWCPPCRRFLPKLVKFYHHLKQHGKSFEIVYISSDYSEQDMMKYMKEQQMPWVGIAFQGKVSEELRNTYSVSAVPLLKILTRKGEVAEDSAKKSVEAASSGSAILKLYNKWHEKLGLGGESMSEEEHRITATGKEKKGLLSKMISTMQGKERSKTQDGMYDRDSDLTPEQLSQESSPPQSEAGRRVVDTRHARSKAKARVTQDLLDEKEERIQHLEEVNRTLKQTNDEQAEELSELREKLQVLTAELEQLRSTSKSLQDESKELIANLNMRGWLYKRGVRGPTANKWRRRYFRLDQGSKLYYYKNSSEGTPQGYIDMDKVLAIQEVTASQQDKNHATFTVQCDGRTFQLQAHDEPNMRKWMDAIQYMVNWRKKNSAIIAEELA